MSGQAGGGATGAGGRKSSGASKRKSGGVAPAKQGGQQTGSAGASTGARNNREEAAVKVSPARRAAFDLLRRVEEEGAFASVLLAGIGDEELRAEDRALCHELVMGVLRWQLWLDYLIAHYASRDAASLDAPVKRALRLGLYQLRFLSRVPVSAAVNESVNLTHRARARSASGFVNAVLRRATRESDYDPAAHIKDPTQRLAIETSHPTWLVERWSKAFGHDEARAFARSNNEAPPTVFRVVTRRAGEAAVIERLRGAGAVLTPSPITAGAWRVEGARGAVRELAREGLIYLQDEASQLVARTVNASAGDAVLDACAAPGSKTTHMADICRGVKLIVAGDVHEHRLRTLRESCARQGIDEVRLIALDATNELPFAPAAFDRVLVDAPCTGTGTLRRNPEIRWRVTPADVSQLAALQRRIIRRAAAAVRPGGRLIYSTCSVESEENEQVVAAFLDENPAFTPAELGATGSLISRQGAARTWPHRDGADGFFVAAFERRG